MLNIPYLISQIKCLYYFLEIRKIISLFFWKIEDIRISFYRPLNIGMRKDHKYILMIFPHTDKGRDVFNFPKNIMKYFPNF